MADIVFVAESLVPVLLPTYDLRNDAQDGGDVQFGGGPGGRCDRIIAGLSRQEDRPEQEDDHSDGDPSRSPRRRCKSVAGFGARPLQL